MTPRLRRVYYRRKPFRVRESRSLIRLQAGVIMMSKRLVGWAISLVLLVTILSLLFYPYILAGTPLASLYTDIELVVVVVLFGGMFFLLFLLLYVGAR